MAFSLGSSLLSPVHTVICVQTLKVHASGQLAPYGKVSAGVMFAGGSYQCYNEGNLALSQCSECSTTGACSDDVTASTEVLGCSNTVRCAFLDRSLHLRMPLNFAPLLHLKLLHAGDQCHSSRVFTPLTSWYCNSRPNTECQRQNRHVWHLS
jgi:hypothetical protein